MSKKTVFSGIQPTGSVHFGNYFGALANWVEMQQHYNCYFCVVNYHAMTMPYQPKKLLEHTWQMAIDMLSIGIEPEHLFLQSLVPEHTELNWILNCFTSYGQLGRMTQFKDKSQQSSTASEGFISAGLFDYPVLQTADILLYKADLVPVGKDQDQHLELTRDIAQRFNQQLGKEYFALPEATYTEAPKILSTADPTRKMSKSAGEKHFISLFETEKRIEKQIKSAVTDTGEVSNTMSPGVENLFTLLRMAGGHEAHESLMKDHASGNLKYVDLKQATSDALIAFNKPIIEKRSELMADRKKVKDQIKQSSYEIRKVAQETIKEVKQLAGLPNVRFT